MAEQNRNSGRATGSIDSYRLFDGTIVYKGARESLISAGVLREEWIPVVVKPGRKSGSVRTRLQDGTAVRVYRRGDKMEVWHEPTKAEMAANKEAHYVEQRESSERRETEAYRYYPRRAPLLAALRARYPGIQVADISFHVFEDGIVQQSIRYLGSIDLFRHYGLVTDAMVDSLNRRSNAQISTPLGDGFSLFDQPIDSQGSPGQWDLSVHTGTVPRERDRLAAKDAARLLKRYMLPRRRRRLVAPSLSGGTS